MKRLPAEWVIIQGTDIALSLEEVRFYQLLANGSTIINASETLMVSKSTCESRMYKLQAELGMTSREHLIATLIRKKIIK